MKLRALAGIARSVLALGLLLVACGKNGTPLAGGEARVERSLGSVATLTSIQLSPATASIPTLVAKTFTATGIYSNGSKATLADLTWTVSDSTVASVDSAGLVTPLQPGSITVTATDPGVTGPSRTPLTASAALTVTAANLVSIAVTPASKQIPIGTSQNFTAMGTFDDGTKFALDPSAVTWATTNSSVATVASPAGRPASPKGSSLSRPHMRRQA